MNSPLKFPRRVRIHGGECGAVARALHHEAQKVALTQNEQMFSSDVKGLMRQADRKKSLRSTLIERKQMSTKTSIKRVALVAVSALGFGLLSVMPASAVDNAATVTISPIRVSFTGGTQDTVSAANVTVASGALVDADTTDNEQVITVVLTTAPNAAAVLTIADADFTDQGNLGGTDTTAQLGDNGILKSSGTDTLATTAADLVDGLTFAANTAGTYKGTIQWLGETGGNTLTAPFSFTTTGAPASIGLSSTALKLPAIAAETVTNTITLKDSAGNLTQSSTVDTLAVTITSAANMTLTTGASLTNSDLRDGTVTYTITGSATADEETVTVTPEGTLPGLGVSAVTFTVTVAALGDATLPVTTVTAPTSSNVIKAGASATAKTADLATTTYSFSISGWTSGSGYRYIADVDDASGAGLTASIGGSSVLGGLTFKGISDGSALTFTVTLGGTPAAGDVIEIDGNGDGDFTDSSDMVITLAAATYAVSVSTPEVSPSIQKTGAAITVTGSVKDQFGTALNAATVTVTGVQTLSTGSAANLTAEVVTAADGSWSATLPAANALTTSVSITAAAVKTGTSAITDTSASPVVVKLNAAGSADSITSSHLGDEDSATTATTLPAVVVPYTGRATGQSNELYTISSAAFDGTFDATTETCIAVTATTDPDGQIVATGSAGVLIYKSACANDADHDVSAGLTTATVADTGAANLWVTSTKTGLNTFTITSGAVSKTYRFYAYNYLTAGTSGDAARNVSVTATKSLKPSEIGTITASVTDAFGNPVVVAATATFVAKVTGGAMIDGITLSKSYTATDDAGDITIGVIAGGAVGSATVTVTGSNAQFGAAVGSVTTTAGTNGLTVSTKSADSTITIAGPAEKSAEVLAAEAAYDAALEAIDSATAAEEAAFEAIAAADAATLAAEEAKASADAATTAIEELSSQVATLMAALQAQITTLANTVAKILKRLPTKK